MASNLFSQSIDLFLHSHVSDREDKLLDAHLLIDQMVCIRIESLLTPLESCLKVHNGEGHWLAILLHQLAQLGQASVKRRELFH